jgi:hypothetical protein
MEKIMSGAKIIEGLKEAIAGNLARVTIDGQVWAKVPVSDFDESDKKTFIVMRALCELASANFPSETEIKMSCSGQSMGSVVVKPWTLLKLLDLTGQ